jgi:MFS family permease
VLVTAGAIGCAALALATSPALYLVAMPVAMMGSWGWPGVIYFTVARSHPRHTARASGVILASNLTGTVTGPAVVGVLAGRAAYTEAWVLCGVLSTVAALATLRSGALLARSRGTQAAPRGQAGAPTREGTE